jgi:hypothetical protein
VAKHRAHVDYLAEALSRYTGTEFSILRGRVPVYDNKPLRTVMRYQLKATRRAEIELFHGAIRIPDEEISYVFQAHRPMPLREMTRWLASICDMVNMGFIPVSKDSQQPNTRSREGAN